MKKFGFGKKDKGDRSGSPASANANPYATQAGGNDAYSQPPPSYSSGPGGNSGFRQEKTPGNASDYGRPPMNDRYGSGPAPSSESRYGGGGSYGGSEGGGYGGSRYGSGGYGGFGGPPNQNAGPNRFGGGGGDSAPAPAPSRYGGGAPESGSRYGGGAPDSGSRYGGGAPDSGSRYASSGPAGGMSGGADPNNRYGGPAPGNRYGGGGYGAQQDSAGQQSSWESGVGSGPAQDYEAYENRQLTAEEQEEEDIQGTKNEIRAIKQQDVSSTRNALRIAQMAEETGRGTLERLQQQGERIHNTERNLDLASNQNRLAASKAAEIKTLNRSMFAVHVANPFTSKQRIREREEAVLQQASDDRERRAATRAAAWSSNDRKDRLNMEMNKQGMGGQKGKSSLADRAKYQFEADSEDEEMENELDNNIDLLAGAAGRMKLLGQAMGNEIESQNKHIERIGGKVDRVDDEIMLNKSRLDRIK